MNESEATVLVPMTRLIFRIYDKRCTGHDHLLSMGNCGQTALIIGRTVQFMNVVLCQYKPQRRLQTDLKAPVWSTRCAGYNSTYDDYSPVHYKPPNYSTLDNASGTPRRETQNRPCEPIMNRLQRIIQAQKPWEGQLISGHNSQLSYAMAHFSK